MPPVQRLYGLILLSACFLIVFISVNDLYGAMPVTPRDVTCGSEALTQIAACPPGRIEMVEIDGQYYQFPEDIKLRNLSIEPPWMNHQLSFINKEYQRLLARQELECRRSARLGTFSDGGWHVCLAEPYHLSPPCLVYDFGIAAKWTFDEAISDEFGCTVRAFDPTIELPEHNRTDKIHFYPVGLWHKNRHPQRLFPVKTFKRFLEQFGEENTTLDVLKIDIDGAEWSVLKAMLKDGSLARVKQLAIELHALPMSKATTMTRYVSILRGLGEAGFRLWRTDWNLKRIRYSKELGIQSSCHEQYYININFLK